MHSGKMLSSATQSRVSSHFLNLIHIYKRREQNSWPQISAKEQLCPVDSQAATTMAPAIQAPARQQDRSQSSRVQASL